MSTNKKNPRRAMALSPVRAAMRGVVVQAAGRRFLAVGYARTTMEAIAAEAGVSVQTLYNSVGNKASLLMAVFEHMVPGPNAPRPVPEFMKERSEAATDTPSMMRVLVEWLVDVHSRMAPLDQVVEEAAAHDEQVAAFARQRAHQRLSNYQLAAEELRRRGALREGLAIEEAATIVWSLGHPHVHRTLVLELKWPPERYRAWLESSLSAALLA